MKSWPTSAKFPEHSQFHLCVITAVPVKTIFAIIGQSVLPYIKNTSESQNFPSRLNWSNNSQLFWFFSDFYRNSFTITHDNLASLRAKNLESILLKWKSICFTAADLTPLCGCFVQHTEILPSFPPTTCLYMSYFPTDFCILLAYCRKDLCRYQTQLCQVPVGKTLQLSTLQMHQTEASVKFVYLSHFSQKFHKLWQNNVKLNCLWDVNTFVFI